MAQNNTEVEKVAINDIGTVDDFIKAVDSTIKNFSDPGHRLQDRGCHSLP